MMLGRCPICHSQISLEAVCQDEAGRELLGILANLTGETSRALVRYLGLFRPEKRDLANDRALRLTREVLALCPDYVRLSAAMAETVEAILGKCGAKSGSVPMKNHNYLKRVLEGMPEAAPVRAGGPLVDAPEMRKSSLRADRRITAAEQAAMAIRSVSFGDDDA